MVEQETAKFLLIFRAQQLAERASRELVEGVVGGGEESEFRLVVVQRGLKVSGFERFFQRFELSFGLDNFADGRSPNRVGAVSPAADCLVGSLVGVSFARVIGPAARIEAITAMDDSCFVFMINFWGYGSSNHTLFGERESSDGDAGRMPGRN
ncbi:MAG: hypothetical protein RLZZ245_98 [Verrucomicrobiota bacterium]